MVHIFEYFNKESLLYIGFLFTWIFITEFFLYRPVTNYLSSQEYQQNPTLQHYPQKQYESRGRFKKEFGTLEFATTSFLSD